MTLRPGDFEFGPALNSPDQRARFDFADATRTSESRSVEWMDDPPEPAVLVVDDSSDMRELLVQMLSSFGYRATAVADGLEAKVYLHEHRPSLVVSDLRMPVCNGWDLLTYCHAHFPDLPILLMSGDSLGTKPEIEAWAAGYLTKPIDFGSFREHVTRLLAH